MVNLEALLAIGFQWIILVITYYFFKKYRKIQSFYLGVIITFLGLLIWDALPWISIWKNEFLFTPKWHHSRIGVFCLILALVYKTIIAVFYDKWSLIRRLHYYIEEKTWSLGPIKLQFFYACLAIAILLVETQLHEIIYFGTFKFPDRGFPLDIRLKLGTI